MFEDVVSRVFRTLHVLFTGKLGAKKQVVWLLLESKQKEGTFEQRAAFREQTVRPIISSLEISATYGCKGRKYPCHSVTVMWEQKVM